MNKVQRGLVLAMAMGDGHVDTSGGVPVLHKGANQDYVLWKRSLIPSISSDVVYKDNRGFDSYTFRIRGSKFMKMIRSHLRSEEYITPRLLRRVGAIGLAILYMDDGSLYPKKRNGQVHAYELVISWCFKSEEKAKSIIEYFNNEYGITFTIKRNKGRYSLRCGSAQARKVIEIVEPYVSQVPSMKYKLNIAPAKYNWKE